MPNYNISILGCFIFCWLKTDFALRLKVSSYFSFIVPVFKGRPRKRRQSRTKGATETKKQRIEKENSNPEIIKKYENSDKEEPNEVEFESEMKNGSGKQTYRIVAPPAHCDPERNVIHVKIESKKTSADLCRVKEAENEEMKIVIKTNCDADDNLIAEKENMMCWNDGNVEDGSTESPQISDDEPMLESLEKDEKARSVKGQNYQNNPPSELVKNGKTGTVLDEAFFREMRNGMKASEEVDKEKMRKVFISYFVSYCRLSLVVLFERKFRATIWSIKQEIS